MYLVFFYEFEMQIMDELYKVGNTFLTILFYLISQFGGSTILIAILGILYWCIDKEKGEKIGFAILTSICLNGLLKSLFHFKRPFQYEEKDYLRKLQDSPLKDSATGSSFPSGHSQNAGALYSSLSIHFRHKPLWIISIFFMIAVPLSRLYLGVHFPSDVVVGLLLGIFISILSYFLLNKFQQKKFWIYFITLGCFTPLMFFPFAEHDFARGYGLFAGFVFGIWIENKYIHFTTDIPTIKKFIRILIGILIVGTSFVILKLLPNSFTENKWVTILSYFTISFLAIGIVPFLFKSRRKPNGI